MTLGILGHAKNITCMAGEGSRTIASPLRNDIPHRIGNIRKGSQQHWNQVVVPLPDTCKNRQCTLIYRLSLQTANCLRFLVTSTGSLRWKLIQYPDICHEWLLAIMNIHMIECSLLLGWIVTNTPLPAWKENLRSHEDGSEERSPGLQAHIPNKNTWEGFLPGI